MFGVSGTSCVGTTAADAPPTSEKVNPAAPNTGTAFVTRFRFEACFTRAILASSISCKRSLESRRLIVRFADFPSKAAYTRWAHRVLGFHVHERCVHKRLRRRLSDYNDPARPRSSTRAGQERPPARGTSRYQSVKQFINCIEASYQQSTGQALRPKPGPRCIAFVVLEGGAVTILAFAPPRRYSG